MRTEPFDEELSCKLTPEEFSIKAKALAEALRVKVELVLERKDAVAEIKLREKAVDKQIVALQVEVMTGAERREVECIERADYVANRVELIRLDTNTVERVRHLLPEERQEKLKLVEQDRRLERTKQRTAKAAASAPAVAEPDNDNGSEPDEFKKGLQ
jgi:hypothetical protein